MKQVTNIAKERLRDGELSIGVGLRMARTVDVAKAVKTAGMDWLFVDMEHSSISVDTAAQICVASLDSGVAPLVRVPIQDYSVATRVLDGGALGIVMPHINSVDEAKRMVAELRFPPLGHRGVTGAMPHFDYDVDDLGKAMEILNDEILLVVMVETQEMVDAADDIAAIEGLDVVMIGTNDLATAMGLPQQFGHERIAAAYRKVGDACRTHGKWMGMGGVGDNDLIEKYVGLGVRFVLNGNDLNYMIDGMRRKAAALRQICAQRRDAD